MDIREEAERWMAADPDPDTRAELQALLEAGDERGLAERFGTRLTFGTAGIRGPLGAGPARMNRVLVRRVTAGLAAYLSTVPDAAARGVVVGRDARHRSEEFAADTAGVLAAVGIEVALFDRPVPTPLLAFAVRQLDAAAGVQVTASHNPAPDNGYKVYWSGGAQIIPPLDEGISAAIDAVTEPPDVADLGDAGVTAVDPHVYPAYVKAALAAVGLDGVGTEQRDLRIAYTPLHGVALDLARGLLHAGGFRDLHIVAEQAEPDPDFPTVAFPNPEEPGALDLVLALAAAVGADLVLANDPDGDRIAVAVPDGGTFRLLSGDEVGCLLGESLLAQGGGPERVVGTTVVSSTLLARIAEQHGAGFVATLTGVKWLAAAAAQAEAAGRRMVLGYEQALGVMVGTAVRDKDGLSAALAVADLAARLKAEGRSLIDALDDLARRHGLHVTRGRSVRLRGAEGTALVRRVLDGLRADPPAEVGGRPVTALEDYRARVRTTPDGATQPLPTPSADLYALVLDDGSRMLVRPSGTEPLLKFYFEVVEPVGDGGVPAARRRAEFRLDTLSAAFLAQVGL